MGSGWRKNVKSAGPDVCMVCLSSWKWAVEVSVRTRLRERGQRGREGPRILVSVLRAEGAIGGSGDGRSVPGFAFCQAQSGALWRAGGALERTRAAGWRLLRVREAGAGDGERRCRLLKRE